MIAALKDVQAALASGTAQVVDAPPRPGSVARHRSPARACAPATCPAAATCPSIS